MSVEPKIEIEPNRVIEINRLGRFYVLGSPKFVHIYAPDFINPDRSGYIIIEENCKTYTGTSLQSSNCLFKMTKDRRLIAALFKSEEMAEEVCFACNRIRI